MFSFERDLDVSSVSCDLLITTKSLDDSTLSAEDCYQVGYANADQKVNGSRIIYSSSSEVPQGSSNYVIVTINDETPEDGRTAPIIMTDFRNDLSSRACFLYHVDNIEIVINGDVVDKPSAWGSFGGSVGVFVQKESSGSPTTSQGLKTETHTYQFIKNVLAEKDYYVDLRLGSLKDKIEHQVTSTVMKFVAPTEVFDATTFEERTISVYNRFIQSLVIENNL